jgi:hypothetical protein
MLNETQVIADIFHNTRGLTRWYLKKMSAQQRMLRPVLEGKVFNSAYWIQAHLAWAESYLIIHSTGGEVPAIPWLSQFSIGANPEAVQDDPDLETLDRDFGAIHERALAHLRQVDPESLGAPSGIAMFPTRRIALYHAIRHEATHTGHLGWLCKMHGIATI